MEISMKKDISGFNVELPKRAREEAEFFLQKSEPCSVSCHAHIHNAVELLYVRRGSYRVTVDDEEYGIEEGDLILFCSNSIHCVYAGDKEENLYYVIKLPPSFLLEYSDPELGAEYIMRFALNRRGQKNLWKKEELCESSLLSVINDLISEYETKKYASEIAVRLKIMELFLAILRDCPYRSEPVGTRNAELIYHIMLYVRKNYAEDINERELAESIGMSYSYFARSFKRVSGITFRKYLNVTRIHKAEQLLLEGRESITAIAARCGYNSTSYFINVFRNVTGKTPYKVLQSAERVPRAE